MANGKLVVLEKPKSPIAEMYRILRTNVQFAAVDKEIKTILLTSSGPGEGKSVTTANLAVAFAQSGKSVIIVDTDMRKPTQYKLWGLENMVGLTNLLIGDEEVEKILQPTPMDNLRVLTTGPIPPNPAEMLGSQRMSSMIKKLTGYADIIIFDSPPVIAVTDAALLAPQVDGVILVVGSGIARIEGAQRVKEMLLNGKARILGTVLNMVEQESQDYYYYYYYYGEGNDKKKKGSKG
ncbi:CpsD/CapB family tyrosine-protein kinase [Desulforamulus aquiferis]|nr:CpsD/CapB family tyrosine-protein kinase [Desulforamulus aquiferis]